MEWAYRFTRDYPRRIALAGLATLLISLWGISRITTNYSISNNLPTGEKITADFLFFEKHLAGFRPM